MARLLLPPSIALLLLFAMDAPSSASEVRRIEAANPPRIAGKEVDWIYGDYLMKNERISLTIAAPLPNRDANMTIRNIGGSILDLTLNEPSNDQLSAYTPTAGRYLFNDPSLVETGRQGDTVFWQCRSSKTRAADGTSATIRYQLAAGSPYVEAIVSIDGANAEQVARFDGVRADGWFTFEQIEETAFCRDAFFRQTIGFRIPNSHEAPTWKRGRPYQLRYADDHIQTTETGVRWSILIYPATSLLDLKSVLQSPDASAMHQFTVSSAERPSPQVASVLRAGIEVRRRGEDPQTTLGTLQTDDSGVAHARLTPGEYVAIAASLGRKGVEVSFDAGDKSGEVVFPMGSASGFAAEVIDDRGNSVPCKATIYSLDGDHPNFGLSSTRTFVENLVYAVHGRLRCELAPGKYEVHFSRGPEYNSERREFQVQPEQIVDLKVRLKRVVDTTGWVSADLHSHSSPSGDNTSDQYGRVENLLCEHLEFAPCTEHNRVSSYSPHLVQMQLSHLLATCTGMELTGSPTPVNHQNAFPLLLRPGAQYGGGPRYSSNPLVQIERLAMWDRKSSKLVQMNHPNLHQIYGDADLDGVADKGFRGMLDFADIVEVHPLETIFQDVPNNPPSKRRMRIPLFQWLQLLNQGRRIPGVVNTDSHYNHHGSGWRRNWIASKTDDPQEIKTEDMVRQLEAGRVVMSNGPFLTVLGESDSATAIPGEDLATANGEVKLKLRVQCPNWLDVNRLQIFVNGRPSEQHNYTRKNSPEMFGELEAVQKFNATLNLKLERDSHVIVATIGEGLTMEKVMGRRFGRRAPIAVSNPIFVDVGGDGWRSNFDRLDYSLPGATR